MSEATVFDAYENAIPANMSDTLLHAKDSDRSERVIFPTTRYDDVLNSPKLLTNPDLVPGAPFHLLQTATEDISVAEIRYLVGNII